jgi:hypothetical protein
MSAFSPTWRPATSGESQPVTVTALFTRRVFTLFERNGAVVDAWWGAGRYDSGFRFRARARSGGTGIGNGSYRATAR